MNRLILAKLGTYVSLSAIPTVWLANLDVGLRLILTCCGITAAIYSIRYHRAQLKKEEKDE